MPVAGTPNEGHYLPGPPGSGGDLWVGDYVRVHTGTTDFDLNEADFRVTAITVQRDDDNAELLVVPELRLSHVWIGEVWAGLCNTNESGAEGYWSTFDSPPAGWYNVPKVGPIDYAEAVAPYYGVTVSADMVVRIDANANWAAVVEYGQGPTIHVSVNATVIATKAHLRDIPGLGYWSATDDDLAIELHDVELQAGDTVSVSFEGGDAWTNFGVNSTYLHVGRGHITGAGGFDWTGP